MIRADGAARPGAWLLAARPRTLPAAVAPVVVGGAAAAKAGSFAPLPLLAALAGALLLQIGVNLANDYFDFRAGIDVPERKGPVRVTQAGLIQPERVRTAMILTFVLAAAVGTYLVGVGGWPILAVGIASIAAALAYSGGPWPLASHGLGDAAVFVFFGPVAVAGTFWVMAHRLSPLALAASLPPGFLITAILVVNNMRDIETDARVGKRTMAVRLGRRGSRAEYGALLLGAAAVPPLIWIAGAGTAWMLLPLASLPLARPLLDTLRRRPDDGPAMNEALAGTARLALVFCLLFSAAMW